MKKWLCLISMVIICFSLCSVTFAATTFKDVAGTKYEDAVKNLVEIGLVNGYPDNTYQPNATVTRAQMAKMMVIALGQESSVKNVSTAKSDFIDMKSEHWAYGYIVVAKNLGIINGYTDGSFGPDEIVTYAEATTMVIRALGYEPEVSRSTEVWPNNYISYAKKLSLYNSIGTFSNSNGAARGNIALLLWNMLRTGVCTVKGQNNAGLVYGQGQIMLNKYKNYIYLDDAEITKVVFDDDFENAKVTITGSEKLTLTMSDSEVLKYLGRKLTLLYDNKAKKIVDIEDVKNYTVEEGSITRLTSSKIYLDDESYTLPDDDNIILYKVDKLSEAIDATIYRSGNTVKYILATGAKSVEVGLVVDNDVDVGKDVEIKIKKPGSTKTNSYALIDEDEVPAEYAVVIYYLNSKDKLGILGEIELDDAKSISSLTSTKIKLGKTTYTYNSSNFDVLQVTTSSIKSLAFKNIDKSKDLAYAFEYAGKTYLIVFTDAVEDEDAKEDAYEQLKSYINTVESLANKEASYSQSTFVPFLKALSDAKKITSTSKTAKINQALETLKTARNALKSVSATSTEGKIAAARAKLRKLVNGDAAKVVDNVSQYTSASYSKFYKTYDAAQKLLDRTDTTLSKVDEAYDNLVKSMNSDNLIKVVETTAHKEAVTALELALAKCAKVGKEGDYTQASYKNYSDAKKAAENMLKNKNSKTAEEINSAATKLEKAIEDLDFAVDALIDELDELIVRCIKNVKEEDFYMPDCYATYKEAYDNALKIDSNDSITDIQKAIDDLKKAESNLISRESLLAMYIETVAPIKTASNVSTALLKDSNTPAQKLEKINAIKDAVKLDLKDLIDDAIDVINAEGASGDGELAGILGNVQKVYNSSKASLDELVDAYLDLMLAMS